jgi:hypothetical protein
MTNDKRAEAIREWVDGQKGRFGGQTSRGVTIEDVLWLLDERDRLIWKVEHLTEMRVAAERRGAELEAALRRSASALHGVAVEQQNYGEKGWSMAKSWVFLAAEHEATVAEDLLGGTRER